MKPLVRNSTSTKCGLFINQIQATKLLKLQFQLGWGINTVDKFMFTSTCSRYEMKGYNTLLGSHYDHYYIDYDSYDVNSIPKETFTIDSSKCFLK